MLEVADVVVTKHEPDVAALAGGAELIDKLAPEWRELCNADGSDEPFCRPEIIRAFVRAFAPNARLRILTARVGGRLKAVLPLMPKVGWFCWLPARQLEAAFGIHSCRFDLAKAPGPEGDLALEAIWRNLRDTGGWDIVHLPLVPENAAASQLMSLARADGFTVMDWKGSAYPYVPLEGDAPEPWFQEMDGHFRRQVQRRGRQLSELGALRFVRVERADPKVLDEFYRLESSGWKGQQGTAINSHADTRQFYDEIAAEAERSGYFALYMLYLNEELLAASFGFAYKTRYLPLKWCYDEKQRNTSPGHVLIHKLLQDCKSRGLTEFDFAGPSEDYKLKWTSHERPNHYYCIFRNSLYGRALHLARFQLRDFVKRVAGKR